MLTDVIRALFKHIKVAILHWKLYEHDFNKCLTYIFKTYFSFVGFLNNILRALVNKTQTFKTVTSINVFNLNCNSKCFY